MSVQSILRTCGSSDMKQRKISSARFSVVSSGGILPRLRQNSFLSRACKFLIRFLVVSAKSSELTSASLRKPPRSPDVTAEWRRRRDNLCRQFRYTSEAVHQLRHGSSNPSLEVCDGF